MLADSTQVAGKNFDYIIVGEYGFFEVCHVAYAPAGGGVSRKPGKLAARYVVLTLLAQTAGLALAARLSEDTTLSVLVLEAGEANLNEKAHRK